MQGWPQNNFMFTFVWEELGRKQAQERQRTPTSESAQHLRRAGYQMERFEGRGGPVHEQ